MFSERASLDLRPNDLSLCLSRMRAEGRPVLDLTESNPTRADIPYDARAIQSALSSDDLLRYEPAPFGLRSAREAVAEHLSRAGHAVDPGHLVLTASTSEAYSFVFKLLADPGDEILVPAPSYPLHEHLARLEAVACRRYRLAYDGAWHVDVGSLRRGISTRSRAIVAVHPNNPTGSYLKSNELDAFASTGLPIVCDEVFATYPLRRGLRPLRARNTPGAPLVFSLGGLSKLSALPQVKLGWIEVSGERSRVDGAMARLELIADTFLSVGTPVQLGARALIATGALAHDAVGQRIVANLERVREAVAGTPSTLLDVEGGWYATLRLPRTRTEEQWVLSLLEEQGVHAHPGHFFDFEGEPFVVLSLLTPESALQEGVERIVQHVARSTGAG